MKKIRKSSEEKCEFSAPVVTVIMFIDRDVITSSPGDAFAGGWDDFGSTSPDA